MRNADLGLSCAYKAKSEEGIMGKEGEAKQGQEGGSWEGGGDSVFCKYKHSVEMFYCLQKYKD